VKAVVEGGRNESTGAPKLLIWEITSAQNEYEFVGATEAVDGDDDEAVTVTGW